MPRRPSRDPWFPAALMLIVLLGVWLGILGPLPGEVTAWFQKWQTLVAAIVASTVASVVAYIAFRNTTRSLDHAEKLEAHRRRRKHAAVRAVLPLTLAQVSDYAARLAHTLAELVIQCSGEKLPALAAPTDLAQTLPSETLETLTDFIEYSDVMDVNVIESKVAWIQIHDSRLRSLVKDNRDPSEASLTLRTNLEGLIIDAATIYAAAAAFFDCARQRQSAANYAIMGQGQSCT